MMEEDKILFEAADKNQDGKLSQLEFLSFTHPEEDAEMIRPVLSLTKKAKDLNNDGKIDFQVIYYGYFWTKYEATGLKLCEVAFELFKQDKIS